MQQSANFILCGFVENLGLRFCAEMQWSVDLLKAYLFDTTQLTQKPLSLCYLMAKIRFNRAPVF